MHYMYIDHAKYFIKCELGEGGSKVFAVQIGQGQCGDNGAKVRKLRPQQ